MLDSRGFDWLVIVFFIVHVPITLLVDSQIVLPRHLFPQPCQDMVNSFVKDYGDDLVGSPPTWFKSLVWVELLFQLPFFPIAAYAFATRNMWIKTPAVIYGVFVAGTTYPLLVHQWFSGPKGPILFAIYLPYFVMPALVAAKFAYTRPFRQAGRAKRA